MVNMVIHVYYLFFLIEHRGDQHLTLVFIQDRQLIIAVHLINTVSWTNLDESIAYSEECSQCKG